MKNMHPLDTISIGCAGYPSDRLTLSELLLFADKVRGQEGILVEESFDHRSVTYGFYKAEDLSSHNALKIDPDAPWLLAEQDKRYKRNKDESVEDWKQRINADILKQGYIVINDKPALVGLLELDKTVSSYTIAGNILTAICSGTHTKHKIYPVKDN